MAEAPDKPWPEDEDGAVQPEVSPGDAAEVDVEVDDPVAATALVPRDALTRYLAEIRRHPLLTQEEEHRIAVRYRQEGDIEAAYALVDRKSTRLNSSHLKLSRMPSSA